MFLEYIKEKNTGETDMSFDKKSFIREIVSDPRRKVIPIMTSPAWN